MGEKFQQNEFTGTFSFSIPLRLTPSRDCSPELHLSYSSGEGNGIFGLGFHLSLPTISRKTAKGIPRYDDSDIFQLSHADDLVRQPEQGERHTVHAGEDTYQVTKYRPRVVDAYDKIERWVNIATGSTHWRVTDREQFVQLFGKTEQARISDPDDPARIYQWLLEEAFDPKGNHISYDYESDIVSSKTPAHQDEKRIPSANKYISRIRYGNKVPYQEGESLPDVYHFEVVFDYSSSADARPLTSFANRPPVAYRSDSFSQYHAGFEVRTSRLCRKMWLFHHFEALDRNPLPVQSYTFSYEQASTVSLLSSVELTGFRWANGEYAQESLPPLLLNYSRFEPTAQTFQPLHALDLAALPAMGHDSSAELIDLYGEGIPGILYQDEVSALYLEPILAQDEQGSDIVAYARPKELPTFPAANHVPSSSQQLMDLAGNGELALVVATLSEAGYFASGPSKTWRPWKSFASFTNAFFQDGHALVDLTGDGLADLVHIDQETITYYPSKGTEGFGEPVRVWRRSDLPLPRQETKTEAVKFADMFGSGMQHLVKVANGSVQCWPNLGYGRFGEPVSMENAPYFADGLDESRLFLVDVDGSGTADLIYAYPDRIDVYLNQSGHSFREPFSVPLPASWDRINQLQFADVHGNGTTSLVFSEEYPTTRHWCYDFCSRQKPYLLTRIENQCGAETRISYRSSTYFYMKDKENEFFWQQHLPFPVQVVEKVESIDWISQATMCTRYAYHHGYYDSVEREFRGFGMVERTDAETLSAEAEPTDVPPVWSKSWYHTGAVAESGELSRQFAREYYQGDPQAYPFPDSTLVQTTAAGQPPRDVIDGETFRQASRSLKGQLLRREVYAPAAAVAFDDQDPAAPYTVEEMNYCVRLLQLPERSDYGVFAIEPQESISYHYERKRADPRIEHSFVLEVDAYGNVLKSCAVSYGRRQGAHTFPEQLTGKVVYEEATVLNSIGQNVYLPGVPVEHKVYHLKNVTLSQERPYVAKNELLSAIAFIRPSEATPLIGWERHYYWDPIRQERYPLGEVSAQKLLCQTETAVVTEQQIVERFAEVLPASQLNELLQQEGGLFPDGDFWWNPGLLEVHLGAAGFYLPQFAVDPFGNRTTYRYDSSYLFIEQTTDALGNATSVQKLDYQTMKPAQVLDPNGNCTEVLFDPFGRVIAMSYYGTEGGVPTGFQPLSAYVERGRPDLDRLLNSPDGGRFYVQGAACYFAYDDFAWAERKQPLISIQLNAQDYASSESRPAFTQLTYLDGFGREHQQMVKVEPGAAYGPDGKLLPDPVEPRWLATGCTLYNNKGKPVKEYEPYYSSSYVYVDDPVLRTFGVSSTLTYDPLGRVIRVDTAKGFFTRVRFTAWSEWHEDENDTILESRYYQQHVDDEDPAFQQDRLALQKASLFARTPVEKQLNCDGKTIRLIQKAEGIVAPDDFTALGLSISQAKELFQELQTKQFVDFRGALTYLFQPERAGFTLGLSAPYASQEAAVISKLSSVQKTGAELAACYEWDVRGNQISGADPRLAKSGERNFFTQYDLAGNILYKKSADAGERWQLSNMFGHVILTRDANNQLLRYKYDALGRLSETIRQDAEKSFVLERIVYGDSPAAQQAFAGEDPAKFNLRGQIYQQYDQAGLVTHHVYDLGGSMLRASRQLCTSYREQTDWGSGQEPSTLLEPTVYTTSYEYDALARLTVATAPNGLAQQYEYHLSGLLDKLLVKQTPESPAEPYVAGISYDAKGQRTRIQYGNDVVTKYEYEPATFRLLRAISTRQADRKLMQDIVYTYDPVGNIACVTDQALSTVFANQQVVKPQSVYTYDALYRLIEGTGREHPGMSPQAESAGSFVDSGFVPLSNVPLNDQQQLRNYTRRFTYDAAGNLFLTKHLTGTDSGSWTRQMTVSERSNRAVETELLSASATGLPLTAGQIDDFFDRNGNAIRMVGIDEIAWNERNNIRQVTVIARESGFSDSEYYVYDSGGTRIRKVTERYANNNTVVHREETIYMGTFEIRRTLQGSQLKEEKHTQKIMDGQHCIAVCLSWTEGLPSDVTSNPQIRFQLENHLGSAVLETDASGKIISLEEYYPYGGTSLVAGTSLQEVKRKLYRYGGKERDSLTGFYYYGARYFAPWLGRWINPDPAGEVDGLNLFVFAQNNPLVFRDAGGYVSSKQAKKNANGGKSKPKKKKLSVIRDANKYFRFSGRPDFDSAGKKIKLKKDQDRRHVIGYDDVIRPSYERIINLVIKNAGKEKFIKWQMKRYQKYKITRAPKESAPVEKHLTFGLTKLNSTPGNLNPENAHENQAIEKVREQALLVEERLGKAFSESIPTLDEVKTIMKTGFKLSDGGTPIKDYADSVRKFVHKRIDEATDVIQLSRILHETKVSTGVDLNKGSGTKEQTSFALSYIEKVTEASDPNSTMTDEERLDVVWSLRAIPKN